MSRPVRDFLSKLFAKKAFYKVNRQILLFSLRNLGIFNLHHKYDISGEKDFLKKLGTDLQSNESNIIFDVGANIGDYSDDVLMYIPSVKIFAFEPHPVHFEKVSKRFFNEKRINITNSGCGGKKDSLKIYDIKRDKSEFGYTMDKEYLEWLKEDGDEIVERTVDVITLDSFVKENGIKKIDLLKIDVEGFEYNVLEGCKTLLKDKMIDRLQFEFNVHNIDNKKFMRDFFKILSGYKLYRLLPAELLPIEKSDPPFLIEIFGYQNIIAIREDIK